MYIFTVSPIALFPYPHLNCHRGQISYQSLFLLLHLHLLHIHLIPLNIRHKKPAFMRNDLRQVKTRGKKAKAKAKEEARAKVVREALMGRACRKGV